MKRERMLQELEQAAEALGLRVSYERLSPEAAPGGLCRVNGEYRVLVDRKAPVVDRVNVLLGAVARFSTEDVFLSPEVRQAVQRRAQEMMRTAEPAGSEADEGGRAQEGPDPEGSPSSELEGEAEVVS